MYCSSCDRVNISNGSDILEISKSYNEKYIGILTSKSFYIRDLKSSSLVVISQIDRDPSSISLHGYNHWFQWINSDFVAIGTFTGYIVFGSLDDNGQILLLSELNIGRTITSYGSAYGALVISDNESALFFIAPNGEIKSKISIIKAPKDIIRKFLFVENHAIFLFSNGFVGISLIKQSRIIDCQPIELQMLSFQDISMVKYSRGYCYFLSFTGTLIRMPLVLDSPEIHIICENVIITEPTRDGCFVVSVLSDNYVYIWSTRTMQGSKARLPISGTSSPPFITSEIDNSSLRFFCSTISECYCISLSATCAIRPSLVFHSSCSVYSPYAKCYIPAPYELLEWGFPIQYSAISSKGDTIAVAGRRGYALFSGDSNTWKFVKHTSYLCRFLWFQSDFYLMISLDFDDPVYKIVLMDKDDLSIINELTLQGVFISADFCDDFFMVATHSVISIFQIVDSEIIIQQTFNVIRKFDQAVLMSDKKTVFILESSFRALVSVNSNESIMEGVSDIQASRKISMLFLTSHRKKYVYYNGKYIRFDSNCFHFETLYGYSILPEYCISSHPVQYHELLVQLNRGLCNNPEWVSQIILAYAQHQGILECVVNSIVDSLNRGYFDKLLQALQLIPSAKNHFLVVALFKVDDNHQGLIKSNLPSYKELIETFPIMKDDLQAIYE